MPKKKSQTVNDSCSICIDEDTGFICDACILSMSQRMFHKVVASRRYNLDNLNAMSSKVQSKNNFPSLQFSDHELHRMKKMRDDQRRKKKLERITKRDMKEKNQSSMKDFLT